MNKDILALGLVILIAGLFLTLAFWPLFGVSGRELADDQEVNIIDIFIEYESYSEGDTVLVYGTISDFYPDWAEELYDAIVGVPVEIDDDLIIILANQNSTDLEVGDDVYGRLTLNEELGSEFWVHDGDLRSKAVLDYASYGLVGAGVAVTVVGVVKD